MISYSSVKSVSRVLSVRDINYELNSDFAFHPAMKKAAIQRISQCLHTHYAEIVTHTLNQPTATHTWATVFEYSGDPIIVIRNLALTKVRQPYRRVLRVRMDTLIPQEETESLKSFAATAAEETEDDAFGRKEVERSCPSSSSFAILVATMTNIACFVLIAALYYARCASNPRYFVPSS